MKRTRNVLTTKEAGERLGVCDSRIRQFIMQGRLAAERVGTAYLIHEADLKNLKRHPTGWQKGRPRKKGKEDS